MEILLLIKEFCIPRVSPCDRKILLTLELDPILSFLIGTLKSRRPLDWNILWGHEYFSLRFSRLTIQAQVLAFFDNNIFLFFHAKNFLQVRRKKSEINEIVSIKCCCRAVAWKRKIMTKEENHLSLSALAWIKSTGCLKKCCHCYILCVLNWKWNVSAN